MSSILAYNIIQTNKNDAEQTIEQSKYKYEMKTNESMAIGFVKNELILIMHEDDIKKRVNLYDALTTKISKFKAPVGKGRSFSVKPKLDNKNSINKLRSY